jgi:uncharacterized protein involved in exopolysaccharide biosynthesis
MSFQLLLQILKSRLVLIVFILIITVATTALITVSLPKKYEATTSLVLTFKSSGPFEQLRMPGQFASGYMPTQVDIIRSHNVAIKVVNDLKLAENTKVQTKFVLDTEGRGDIKDWLADGLLRNISVKPSRDSLVLKINYSSTDPHFSAAAADAFAQAYIQATIELSMEPARRTAEWFDNHLKALRARLEKEQAQLTSYQQDKGIIATDERLDTETRRLDKLSTSLVEAQEETSDVRSRKLGWKHPEYQRAVEREASLQDRLKAQKDKLLALKRQRDELNMLAREVETTRSTYEAGLQRYYQSSLESQFNQTNIAVLSKAVPPVEQTSPNLVLNLVISVFLGLVIGLGFALIIEMVDRRVRVEKDVTDGLGLPVIANL